MKIGIYNMAFEVLGGGERQTAALAAHLGKRNDVTLFVRAPVSAQAVKLVFGIDVSTVRIVPLGDDNHAAQIAPFTPDLFINNSHCSALPSPAPRGIYMCMFPEMENVDLASYQTITTNSQYAADWILQRWGRRAEVVYSACEDFGPMLPKENIILHVARFFADSGTAHHKRHDALLGAFKQMVDEGTADWELRFVGNVGEDQERDLEFLETLRSDAARYPVRILPNFPYDELRENYRKASIYWHATGFGTSAADQPSKQEHFGITVVEAMSAGAVPLAFNSGGPRETIVRSVTGYLWNDIPELKRLTRHLMNAPSERRRMAEAATAAARQFNAQVFFERMDRLIDWPR